MSKIEFFQFLEAQQLNGLQKEHLQRAVTVLQEMGCTGPSIAQATNWINRKVWA
jgi:hypothetical protein